ncbi:MAG: mechanosensitive ion channel [Candidatus Pacebacteria bacterium]|nr:mechanosensitive ion channel [Candidatus Paceibacterota bacterium]
MKYFFALAVTVFFLVQPAEPVSAITAESTLNAVTEALKPQVLKPEFLTTQPSDAEASPNTNPNSEESRAKDQEIPPGQKTPSNPPATTESLNPTKDPNIAQPAPATAPTPTKTTASSSPNPPEGNGPKSSLLVSFQGFFVTSYQFILNRAVNLSLLSGSMAAELKKWPSSLFAILNYHPDSVLLARSLSVLWKSILILFLSGLLLPLTRWVWIVLVRFLSPQFDAQLPNDQRFGYSHSSHLGMDMVALMLFILVSYSLTFALSSDPLEFTILLTLLTSAGLVQLLMILARMILSPRFVLSQRLHLSSASVFNGINWLRRFALVALIGFATIVGMQLLGWPEYINAFLLKLLTLVLLVMAITVIILKRHLNLDFASLFSIHFRGERNLKNDGILVRIYRSLGHFWWILSIFYLTMLYSSWAFRFQGGAESLLKRSGLTLVIILAMQLIINSLLRLRLSTLWITKRLSLHLPLLERRMGKYESSIRNLICLFIGSIAAIIIAELWGINSLKWLESSQVQRFIRSSFEILLVVISSVLIWEVLGSMIEQTLMSKIAKETQLDPSLPPTERMNQPASDEVKDQGNMGEVAPVLSNNKQFGRLRTLLPLLRNLLFIILASLLALTVLAQLGVNIGPLIAGAGFLGIGLGFGAQTLVKDLISGLFIIIEDTVNIGDIIEIAGKTGEVESMTVRTVRIRDGDGTLHTIPFGTVTAVSNLSRLYSTHKAEVHISRAANVDQVCQIMLEIDEELRQDPIYAPLILEPLTIRGIELMNSTQVAILASQNTKKGEQFTVKRHFNFLLLKRFQAENIPLPGQIPVLVSESPNQTPNPSSKP